VTGGSGMTFPRAIWLALAGIAGVWSLFMGVPFGLTLLALTCAVSPPLVGAFVHGSASPERTAELEALLWVGLATVSVSSTGGASSPLMIIYAVAVAFAWMSGHARLTAEAAGFSLLGLAFASAASLNGTWLDTADAQALGVSFGVSALALLGGVA